MNKIIMTLAIKGHPTRGREVIQLLEMLGGRNVSPFLKGDALHQFYHIRESNNEIICFTYSTYKDGYKVFTLEEFEEKFPYKAGDKVQHKGATSCGSVFEVEKMRWVDNHVEYTIKRLWYNNCHTTVKAEDLQPYKEETMEEKGILVQIDLTREMNVNDEVELILGDYEFVLKDGKTYFIKKKPQYPKTYGECSLINGCEDRIPLKIIEEFIKLINARNAYWKIAGEEMGLGKPWKPDWNNVCDKYTIYVVYGNEIWRDKGQTINALLAFPTAEMRDAFYENFKDLIEQCKELL